MIGLTQALAAEFGPQGVRVNALLPGGTDTPMAHVMNGTAEALAHVASLHALKRLARPDEMAQAALFLASDASSFMTGSAMLVDGGGDQPDLKCFLQGLAHLADRISPALQRWGALGSRAGQVAVSCLTCWGALGGDSAAGNAWGAAGMRIRPAKWMLAFEKGAGAYPSGADSYPIDSICRFAGKASDTLQSDSRFKRGLDV